MIMTKRRTGTGGNQWPNGRLTLALRLLAFLPPRCGVTRSEICEHLEIDKRRFHTLVEGIGDAGVSIESAYDSQTGLKRYWVVRQGADFVERMLNQS